MTDKKVASHNQIVEMFSFIQLRVKIHRCFSYAIISVQCDFFFFFTVDFGFGYKLPLFCLWFACCSLSYLLTKP